MLIASIFIKLSCYFVIKLVCKESYDIFKIFWLLLLIKLRLLFSVFKVIILLFVLSLNIKLLFVLVFYITIFYES